MLERVVFVSFENSYEHTNDKYHELILMINLVGHTCNLK
jgi:hypothetical protein